MTLEKSATFSLKDIRYVNLLCRVNGCDGEVRYDLRSSIPRRTPRCPKCSRELANQTFSNSIPGLVIYTSRRMRTGEDQTEIGISLSVPIQDTTDIIQLTEMVSTTLSFELRDISHIILMCRMEECGSILVEHEFADTTFLELDLVASCSGGCGYQIDKAPREELDGIRYLSNIITHYKADPDFTLGIRLYVPLK